MDSKSILVLESYKASYDGKEFFDYPYINIRENSSLGILGESGCGKSTLLNSLFSPFFNGYRKYGRAEFLNSDIFQQKDRIYEKLSYMPQFSQNGFNPSMNMGSQIELIMRTNKIKQKKKLYEYMEELSLSESILDKYPYELSGGMKQRIALLLGFIKNPKLFVMDEPSSAVDYITLSKLIDFIQDRKREGTAIFLVTHHNSFCDFLCDEKIILGDKS